VSSPATVADPRLAAFEAAWDDFFHAIRRARARSTRDQPDGLSASQVVLLRPLLDRSPRPVGELAEQAAVAGATATRMLDGLERDGIVTRTPATHDRRVVTVALTDHGATVLAAKLAAVLAQRRELFEELTPAQRAGGAALLRRLTDIVERL
jgi:DNA-binding MarR family transcriptional regulator